uniref:Twinfilin n=2 Tax=Macrostomum lignano TaxID=282301 RepID=A0A1I8GR49_9PLAT
MAHQTGIRGNDELSQAFAEAVAEDSNWRFLKVVIRDESLELETRAQVRPGATWRDQFDECLTPHLVKGGACYLFYRLDSTNSYGYQWLFMQYVHDSAPIRAKMLYSATAATVKRAFGGEHLASEGTLTGTQPEDLCLSGYDRHLASASAPPPLTQAEEERAMVREMERVQAGIDERQQTLAGVGFNMSDEAADALRQFAAGKLDYVQVSISLRPVEELRCPDRAERLAGDQLGSRVPEDSPRYHLFRYRHRHEGASLAPVLFAYSMPGYKCPIKERMVYSSGRAFFLQQCSQFGIEPDRRLEVDSASELSESALQTEFHPPQVDSGQKFGKPKPPGRRGGK